MTPTHVMPDLSEGFAADAGERPVFLDGLKVLLDRKVALYPVELEERPEERNGTGAPDRARPR